MGGSAIGVVSLGKVPAFFPQVIAAHIEGYLALSAGILEPRELPEACLDARRMQYDAGKLIDHLAGPLQTTENPSDRSSSGCTKIIGLLAEDLFLPIFTHVFGEAEQGGRHAVISLYRLKYRSDGTTAPESQVYERAAKVALHEIGHLFNLFHCTDARCLMHFAEEPDTLDAIPINFCPYCTRFINDACRRAGLVKEKYF